MLEKKEKKKKRGEKMNQLNALKSILMESEKNGVLSLIFKEKSDSDNLKGDLMRFLDNFDNLKINDPPEKFDSLLFDIDNCVHYITSLSNTLDRIGNILPELSNIILENYIPDDFYNDAEMNSRAFEAWSPEEGNMLRDLVKEGNCDFEIGKKLLRTPEEIGSKRLELDMFKEINQRKGSDKEISPSKEYSMDGKTDREIGEKLEKSSNSIEEKQKELGLWSDEEVRLLRYLGFDKHETYREIADKIGRSPEEIRLKLGNIKGHKTDKIEKV